MWLFNEHLWNLNRRVDDVTVVPNMTLDYIHPDKAVERLAENGESEGLLIERYVNPRTSRYKTFSVLGVTIHIWINYAFFFHLILFFSDFAKRHYSSHLVLTCVIALCFFVHLIGCMIVKFTCLMRVMSVKLLALIGSCISVIGTTSYFYHPTGVTFSTMVVMKALGYSFAVIPSITVVSHYMQRDEIKGKSPMMFLPSFGTVVLPLLVWFTREAVGYWHCMEFTLMIDFFACVFCIGFLPRTRFIPVNITQEELNVLSAKCAPGTPIEIINKKAIDLYRFAMENFSSLTFHSIVFETRQPVDRITALLRASNNRSVDYDVINDSDLEDSQTFPMSVAGGNITIFPSVFRAYQVLQFKFPTDPYWVENFRPKWDALSQTFGHVCLVLLIFFPSVCIELGATKKEAAFLLTIVGVSFGVAHVIYRFVILRKGLLSAKFLISVSGGVMAVALYFCELYTTFSKQAMFAMALGAFGLTAISLKVIYMSEVSGGRCLEVVLSSISIFSTIFFIIILTLCGYLAYYVESFLVVCSFMTFFLVVINVPIFLQWMVGNVFLGLYRRCCRSSEPRPIPDAIVASIEE